MFSARFAHFYTTAKNVKKARATLFMKIKIYLRINRHQIFAFIRALRPNLNNLNRVTEPPKTGSK